MASLVYIVLSLYLHACAAARPLKLSDKHIQLSTKDVAERIAKHGDMVSDHETSVVQMENHKLYLVNEAEEIEGKKVSTWKILQQATGTEIWKKAARSMLESSPPPSDAQKNVRSKDNDTPEDIDVMDYAQPHRKPPIHNRGT